MSTSPSAVPPRPDAQPAVRRLWNEEVVDPHPWLRDADDPAVIAHLEAENAHTAALLAPTETLQAQLFDEIKARVKETDLSVPVVKDGWSYYGRTIEGQPYGIHCRKAVNDDGTLGAEQILLDENVEAASSDSEYFEIGVFEVSPDHSLLIWGVDRSGDERFEVRVRTLVGDAVFDDVLEGTSYGSAWAMDNRSFFYLRVDDANRPFQVWHHVLGQDPAEDRLVFEELDERFFVGVGRDKDDSFIHIGLSSAITDETWLIPADDPTAEPRCFAPRRDGVEYSVAHHRDGFLVLTNLDAQNFRVCRCAETETSQDNWDELISHRSDVMLTGFDLFDSHLVLFERAEGLTRISLGPWGDVEARGAEGCEVLSQSESVYAVWAGANPSADSTVFRFGYSSMVTPPSVFTYDLLTGERVLLKQQEVLGDFDPSRYETFREWATAPDGTQVPISVVRRVDRDEILAANGIEGPGPTLLYAYGAYEASMDPTFSTIRLLLLDRGFAHAIAHPRGGGEMGRSWYETGKFEYKINTFTDMVACAEHLIEAGITQPERLAIRGGSAGGLMVGAVLNLAPELFGAAVAEVPFVDVINTMLDPTLPLTVTEWEEWGNPAQSEPIYRAMRGYAPLENVADRPYPAVFASGGLTDPRVGFWEPAKWVLALREHTTSDRPILLRTEMEAGHFGPTGRYAGWKDEARTLAFVLWALGVDGVVPAGATASGR